MRVEESFEIGGEHGQIGRPFEVEVSPIRQGMACEGALAALARADEQYGRERAKKEAETLGLQSLKVMRTLYFCIMGSKIQDMLSCARAPHRPPPHPPPSAKARTGEEIPGSLSLRSAGGLGWG